MTLAQIRTQLQALGYDVGTASQQTAFINDAYRYICGLERWPFLEKQNSSLTLASGLSVVSYASITDLVEFDAVRLMDAQSIHYNLENVAPQDMRDFETDYDTDIDTPQFWSLISNAMHFWPTADLTYTINVDYIFQPPDLVADGDIPVIPLQYHDVLVWGAARLIAYRQRDIYSEQTASQQFEERMTRMSDAYKLRQRQTSSRVKRSGWWGRSPGYMPTRGW